MLTTDRHNLLLLNNDFNLTRRNFLKLSGLATLGYMTNKFAPGLASQADRLTEWAPNSPFSGTAVEWRYVAGRIVDGNEDYGFIVSMSDLRALGTQQLLVQRKNLIGDGSFTENVYTGTLTYDTGTSTYTFEADSQTLATWQLDETNQEYRLTVTTTELTLTDVALKLQGELIAEGGDGDIRVGQFQNILVGSDYHADWTRIEIGGQPKGVARVDMQGLRPVGLESTSVSDYDHHWFAVAAELANGQSVWVSAWRIEDANGPYWVVTIASGSGSEWTIERSLNEDTSATPLTIEVLAWQATPLANDQSETGYKWHIVTPDPADLDVVITVPTGQFITGTPLEGVGGPSFMQEAIGLDVSGTILGQTVSSVSLAVAESTAEFYRQFMPLILK